jgi:asparagine synthase (glutamine-hydrolysing)
MCGIGVSLDTDGRRRAVPWALPLMRHRGPDGEGVLALEDAGIVFEHCRLAIIDPSNPEADQPFTDPTGRWVLVYNGELFNFRQLRAGLERRGIRFRTNSDTEVVLQSFLADGEEALTRFRGMFAFVIWDRETGELVAARDQVGVKPLYYSFTDGLFVAASELRTILHHPALRPKLDLEGVVEYLAFGYTLGERTLIEGIHKLEPGHALRLRDRRLETIEYWDALPPEGMSSDGRSQSELEEELVALLEESVSAAMVSDVPVSLMLSGGLDSSTVAVLGARASKPSELTAYSVSFGLESDESPAAARLATDLGIRHRELVLTHEDLRLSFESWLAGMDIPSANPTSVAISHIARAVHEDGTKVLLSGDGGDELFGGYNRWMKYLRFHDQLWGRFPRPLRRIAGGASAPFLNGLAGDIARRAREGGDLFVGSRPFHDDDLDRYLGPTGREAAAAGGPERWIERLRERFDNRFPGADYLTWMSYASLKTNLVEDYLARLDKLAMRESVEGRVPLLDPVLVRWAFTVPQKRKVNGFEQKALFRRAVARVVPPYVTERPKQGFCPPVAGWAQTLLSDSLNGSSALADEGIVAPSAIEQLQQKPSTGDAFALWTLGTLMAWCDRNL